MSHVTNIDSRVSINEDNDGWKVSKERREPKDKKWVRSSGPTCKIGPAHKAHLCQTLTLVTEASSYLFHNHLPFPTSSSIRRRHSSSFSLVVPEPEEE